MVEMVSSPEILFLFRRQMMETQGMMNQLTCIMERSEDRASSSLILHHHVHNLTWHLHDPIVLLRGWKC